MEDLEGFEAAFDFVDAVDGGAAIVASSDAGKGGGVAGGGLLDSEGFADEAFAADREGGGDVRRL